MTSRAVVRLIDDLDGSDTGDVATVRFGLDGCDYEIDLTPGNAARLRAMLEQYIGVARWTTTPPVGRRARTIRDWAKENGLPVCDRGRLKGDVLVAFVRAQSLQWVSAAPDPGLPSANSGHT